MERECEYVKGKCELYEQCIFVLIHVAERTECKICRQGNCVLVQCCVTVMKSEYGTRNK